MHGEPETSIMKKLFRESIVFAEVCSRRLAGCSFVCSEHWLGATGFAGCSNP
jgi:hypothetical protein